MALNFIYLRKRRVQKLLAWEAGWAVLEVEFLHVFEHVIEYFCEKEGWKKWWHGRLEVDFWHVF